MDGKRKPVMLKKNQLCVVCEAGILVSRFSADTCDDTCTRAKANKRSRVEQIKAEMDAYPWEEPDMLGF